VESLDSRASALVKEFKGIKQICCQGYIHKANRLTRGGGREGKGNERR